MSNGTNDHPTTPSKPMRRRWPLVATLLVLVALLGAFAATASNRGFAAHAMRGFGPHGGMGRHHGGEPPSVEEMREHIEFKTEWMLRKIDATPEQTTQIQAIAVEAAESMMELHGERAALRDEIEALVTAESIDTAALETLRQERMALMDSASQQLVKAAGEALQLLTPEQRVALAERFGRRHRR